MLEDDLIRGEVTCAKLTIEDDLFDDLFGSQALRERRSRTSSTAANRRKRRRVLRKFQTQREDTNVPVVDAVSSWRKFVAEEVASHAQSIADDIGQRIKDGVTTAQGLVVHHEMPDDVLKRIPLSSRTKARNMWKTLLQGKLRAITSIINSELQVAYAKKMELDKAATLHNDAGLRKLREEFNRG